MSLECDWLETEGQRRKGMQERNAEKGLDESSGGGMYES